MSIHSPNYFAAELSLRSYENEYYSAALKKLFSYGAKPNDSALQTIANFSLEDNNHASEGEKFCR